MKRKTNHIKIELKKLLADRGKTQKELAEHLDMSESALSHLFSRGTFNRENMIKIAKFLNVDLAFFNQNSQVKSSGSFSSQDTESSEDQAQYLKQVIEAKEQVIEAQAELIRTLKEKKKE